MNIDLIEQHGFKLLDLVEKTSRVYIWRAVQTTLDRSVFLVILNEESSANLPEVKYFLHIAQQFAKLKSESLAAIFDIVSEDNIHYVIMEDVEGESLDEILQKGETLDFRHIMRVALSIAGCLKQLWNKYHIIHRNLKGSTIRFDSRGIAKITDFSLAVVASDDFDISVIDKGHVLGAPSFLSPEQSRADEALSPHSDMYALGAVLYYISTGQAPFSDLEDPDILSAHLSSQLTPPHHLNPELPPVFSRLLHKLMMKEKEDRYQNWEEIQHDLHCIVSHKEPVCAQSNIEHESSVKPEFSERMPDEKQQISFKIKPKKRNKYLSSMQDKHVSHHHEFDLKKQRKTTQLILWSILVIWFATLFWFRTVHQVDPQNQRNLLENGKPTEAAETNQRQQGNKSGNIPQTLVEAIAKALAQNDLSAAITAAANDNHEYFDKVEVLALLKRVPSSDILVAKHLRKNIDKALVLNFKGKPRKVLPRDVNNNTVKLEANGRFIYLKIATLSVEQKINWIDDPVTTEDNIATALLFLQGPNTAKVAKYAAKCGPLDEAMQKAVQIKTR